MANPLHDRRLWWAVALLLMAYLLRLFWLDEQSIWWDEGISLHLGTSSLGAIVADRLSNIHPPLYFVLLKGWLALAGVSPFAGRYLSLLASLLQAPLAFALTGVVVRSMSPNRSNRWVRAVPWLAAGLVSIAPLSVIYGQEIRVYAMLPLVFLGMLLFAERLLACGETTARLFVYLGLVEWLALHLHYIALFGVVYVGLWGVIHYARRRDRQMLGRWIALHLVVGLACLPWFAAVVANWSAVQAEASAGTFAAEEVPLAYLFPQVWTFQLTGLAGALGRPFARVAAPLVALLAAALLVWRLLPRGRVERRGVRGLSGDYLPRAAAHWAVPLLSALAVWAVRSFSHPRYIIMYTAAFFPLAALLILPARRAATRVLAALFAGGVILLSLWGLLQYFTFPGAAKPDMRNVARYLEETAAPDDVIFVPDTDWSLPFEYRGQTPIRMPHLDEPATAVGALDDALRCLAGKDGSQPCVPARRAFLVDYDQGTLDWQGRLPFELERRGSLVGTEDRFDDLTVREYLLAGPGEPLPACGASEAGMTPVGARFGPLTLVSAWIEKGAASNTAAAVALCWRVEGVPTGRLTSSLVLADATGDLIAQTDTLLVDDQGRPADQWQTGQSVTTYHLLPFVSGAPPLAYRLSAGVYTREGDAIRPLGAVKADGTGASTVPLGEMVLGPVEPAVENPYGVPPPPLLLEPLEMGDSGLALVGAAFDGGSYRPGQSLRARLWWRAERDGLTDLRPELRLEQNGVVVASAAAAPAQGRYPTTQWRPGELVAEARDLRVPPNASGPAQLALVLGNARYMLGSVDISGEGVSFDAPSPEYALDATFGGFARLAGFDLPERDLKSGEPLAVTFYWRALGSAPLDYTVFVHLIAPDGRVVAQHDGPPSNGTRPTTDWLAGEYLVDPHLLEWREPGYSGPAQIVVGLYDPATGARIPVAIGARSAGDSLALPVTVTVAPGN